MISRDGGRWWHLHPSGQKVRGQRQRHYSTGTCSHGVDPLIWQKRWAMRGKQSVVSPDDLQPGGVAVRPLPCAWMPCLGSLQQALRFYPVRVRSPLTTWLGIPGFDRTRITSKVLLSKTGSKGSRGNQRTNRTMVLIFKILPSL